MKCAASSPLLSVNLGLEMLASSLPSQDGVNQKIVRDSRTCVKILVNMVTQMLTVSRLEHGSLEPNLESLDLAALCSSALESVRWSAGSRSLALEVPPALPSLKADADLLRRCLDNLLSTRFGQVQDEDARRGFGLGLLFVRLAIEAHGGRVGVESAEGHGSTFWLVLPLHRNASA